MIKVAMVGYTLNGVNRQFNVAYSLDATIAKIRHLWTYAHSEFSLRAELMSMVEKAMDIYGNDSMPIDIIDGYRIAFH